MAQGKKKRSRNGCITCRVRHLKCDLNNESANNQPCNNCTRSNRVCERGVRLNFVKIDTHVPPRNPYTYYRESRILDQSIGVATYYKNGEESYKRYKRLHSVSELEEALHELNNADSYPESLIRQPIPVPLAMPDLTETYHDRTASSYHTRRDSGQPVPGIQLPDSGNLTFDFTNMDFTADPYFFREKSSSTSSEQCADFKFLIPPGKCFPVKWAPPISDIKEAQLVSFFLTSCVWILDLVNNANTGTVYNHFWAKNIISAYVLPDPDLRACVFACSEENWEPRFSRISTSLLSARELPHGFHFSSSLEFCANFGKELLSLEAFKNIDIASLNENKFLLRNLEKYCLMSVLLLLTSYLKLCKKKQCSDAHLANLDGRITNLGTLLIERLLHQSTPPPYSPSKFPINSLIVEQCIISTLCIDTLSAVLLDRRTLISPWCLPRVLEPTEWEISKRSQLSAEVEVYLHHRHYGTLTADSPHPTNFKLSIEKEFQISCDARLFRIFRILAQTIQLVHHPEPGVEVRSSDIMLQILWFENTLPAVLTPIGFEPIIDVSAKQGLWVTGLLDVDPKRPMPFKSIIRPPFHNITFNSITGLIIHIIHHAVYLLSEKIKGKSWSFFDHFAQGPNYHSEKNDFFRKLKRLARSDRKSNLQTGFRTLCEFSIVKWYNCSIPDTPEYSDVSQANHMARRLVSMFLSIDARLQHEPHSPSLYYRDGVGCRFYIWENFRWCLPLAKDFLNENEWEVAVEIARKSGREEYFT